MANRQHLSVWHDDEAGFPEPAGDLTLPSMPEVVVLVEIGNSARRAADLNAA